MTTLASSEPPSACVLDFWSQSASDSDLCPKAVAQLLLLRPQLAGEITSLDTTITALRKALHDRTLSDRLDRPRRLLLMLGLAEALQLAGRPAEAEALCSQAAERLGTEDIETHELAELAGELDRMLRTCGSEGLSRAVRRSAEMRTLMGSHRADGGTLRNLALECVHSGDYARAEQIYRHLTTQNFELPSTLCHLARVYLATDRIAEAREVVSQAAEHLRTAAPYIAARIRFLQALLASVDGGDIAGPLAALTRELQAAGSHCDWHIEPALEGVRSRLTPESHTFFVRLAATLNDRVP